MQLDGDRLRILKRSKKIGQTVKKRLKKESQKQIETET